jgi:hypothetical protein
LEALAKNCSFRKEGRFSAAFRLSEMGLTIEGRACEWDWLQRVDHVFLTDGANDSVG